MILKNNFYKLQTSQVRTLQLEEELQLTKFLMERLTDAVFWITPDAQVIYVNYAACSLVGYSCEELLSMTIHDVILDFPQREKDVQRLAEVAQRRRKVFESWLVEMRRL